MKHFVQNTELTELARKCAMRIERYHWPDITELKVYPIPRGGVPALYAVAKECRVPITVVDTPAECDLIIDDLIDSGATAKRYRDQYNKAIFVLIDKALDSDYFGRWVVFPWENDLKKDDSLIDNITRMLQFIGEDPTRGGLLETPSRVAKAWEEWTSGYKKNPAEILKVFEDGAEGCDQIVLVRDIPFYSHCEHHMAPFFGIAHVGYIPDKKIVGLSKIPELVDIFARRLQVQERLTNQIADALQENLKPKGVGVSISARHLCMESRGKKKTGSSTVTSALRGTMLTEASCRSEFYNLIKL